MKDRYFSKIIHCVLHLAVDLSTKCILYRPQKSDYDSSERVFCPHSRQKKLKNVSIPKNLSISIFSLILIKVAKSRWKPYQLSVEHFKVTVPPSTIPLGWLTSASSILKAVMEGNGAQKAIKNSPQIWDIFYFQRNSYNCWSLPF